MFFPLILQNYLPCFSPLHSAERLLHNILSRARVIDASQFTNSEVHILSKVKIKNLNTKKVFEYLLVSPEEADFQAGKISVTSPVGKGLLGAKAGDKVSIKAPAGLLEFEILELM